MRYVGPRRIVIDGSPTPTPYWCPGQEFVGATVAVLGNGPSLYGVKLDGRPESRFLIAVNSACVVAKPFATKDDLLYFTDNSWAENRPELITSWPGRVVTSNRNAKARLGDAVSYINITELTQWINAPIDAVQASSGHSAVVLAARMGAARILLLGFDCRRVNGRSHWHADYSEHNESVYIERFLPGWRGLAPAIAGKGVELVNATPDSAIDCIKPWGAVAC